MSRQPILRKEVETCGLCHARRGEFSEDWIPGQWLSDTHAVATLSRGLYRPTGRCSTRSIITARSSRARCSRQASPAAIATTRTALSCGFLVTLSASSATHPTNTRVQTHNHHAGVSPTVGCASCHMPARTYMVVDTRHDHSFRIPRPDLSVKLGTPNACNDCHKEKSAEWAAHRQSKSGLGRTGKDFRITPRHSMRHGPTNPMLQGFLQPSPQMARSPSFVQASALTQLNSNVSPSNCRVWRGLALPILIPWCASARSICCKTCLPLSSGPSFLRCFPIQASACASEPLLCSPAFRAMGFRRAIARSSSMLHRSSSPRSD